MELELELRAVLRALKESISPLQNTKQEIIQKVETALQNKFKICDTELKNELDKMKMEVITATEQQLSLTNNEIFNRTAASEISTKFAISRSADVISNSKVNIITQFANMRICLYLQNS